MKFRFALFSLLLISLVTNQTRAADSLSKLPDTFDVKAIDAFLSGQAQQPNRVGISVAIVKNGQVVLAKGYGKRAVQDERVVETNTLFAIGSVTKQFTCAAILLLAEEGKLSVHDAVEKYYPK